MVSFKRVFLVFVFLLPLSWSSQAWGANILKCSSESRRCIVRLDKGIVGDTVNVLNEKAQVIATGWIIKRQGTYGVVSFKQVLRAVKKGYPVIVNTKRQNYEVNWASAFGPSSEIQ